ncbi:MAG: membrane protein insertion efficiency factor YidD [Pseudooceanicola sp.]
MSPLAKLFQLPFRFYRVTFSSWVGHNCRYDPTCSAYALEALEKHGAFKGLWLTVRRVARCHPWGGMGVDDVPD